MLLSESEIRQIFSRWQAQNPEPASELEYVNPFTLLVAVVLSAQATDKSVNLATKDLHIPAPKQVQDFVPASVRKSV